ncbi:hypothetical protein AGOR_G00050480 [Albula goreensis]|uniref:Cilia- and flagella-associated protein 157 n=1 Tax=Albula goreensis TaxID=1534307 RepID=A0A8T3DU92_9TELE|nr:hypothetical protein AGOR_G00050480 [Albula goreensis]
MPPKGKVNKDLTEKTGKTKSERVNSRERNAGDSLAEFSREYYNMQIRDLEHQLGKYKQKYDELEVQQKDFSNQYSTLEREKKDIVLYLKKTLTQREDDLSDLSEQLLRLQQAKEAEKESFEKQLAQLRQDFQENKDQLTSENMVLVGKLASLEEFRVQKDELMERLVAQEEQLEKQRKEHQLVIQNLERKNVLDNDKLKKEMQQHIVTMAAELRLVTERKMPDTTMRAIRENLSVTTQLCKLSEKTQELIEENKVLREREEQLKREMAVLKPLLKDNTKRNLSNHKVLHQLTMQCNEQCIKLKEYENSQTQFSRLQEDHNMLQQDVKGLRQEIALLREELEQNNTEAEKLTKDLEREKDRRGKLEKVQQEVAKAMKQALKEVPKENTATTILSHRNQLMWNLLIVLDNAKPCLTEFIKETQEYKTG